MTKTLDYVAPASAHLAEVDPSGVREAAWLAMLNAGRQAGVELDKDSLCEIDRQPFWQAKETLEDELAPRLIQDDAMKHMHGIRDDEPPSGYFIRWQAGVRDTPGQR